MSPLIIFSTPRITNGKQIVEIPAADASANSFSYTLCFGEIIFGSSNSFEVSALEMYSKAHSENRIGYEGDTVKMDIGPVGKVKSGSIFSSNNNQNGGQSSWKDIFKNIFK